MPFAGPGVESCTIDVRGDLASLNSIATNDIESIAVLESAGLTFASCRTVANQSQAWDSPLFWVPRSATGTSGPETKATPRVPPWNRQGSEQQASKARSNVRSNEQGQ